MGSLKLKLLDGLINHFLKHLNEACLENDLGEVDLFNKESLDNQIAKSVHGIEAETVFELVGEG